MDYTTQVKQSASWYKPTTPAAVHDNIHYNQIGYNELGRESARNALIMLGELAVPDVTPYSQIPHVGRFYSRRSNYRIHRRCQRYAGRAYGLSHLEIQGCNCKIVFWVQEYVPGYAN